MTDPRPRFRRRSIAGAGTGLVLLLLAACGGNSAGTPTSESVTTGSQEPVVTQSGVTGSAPVEATNKTLTVGVATLQQQYADPVLGNEGGNTYPIKWSVGEPLVRQDLDTSWVPALATEWSVADDNLTWTFTLREGVKMHDGSDFTAQDVKTSVERVAGADFLSYAAYSSKIDSVEVVDDHTVTIKTNVPYATLPYDTPPPIATEYYNRVGDEEFRKQPVAAGPFKFDSQIQNDSMTLTTFTDFWDEDRIANFDTLVLKIVPEESSRISGIQTGTLDMAQGISPNGAEQLSAVDGVNLVRIPDASRGVVFFADNYFEEASPLKDERVRKALLMAVDREAIADSLYRGYGSVPANVTFPTTLGNDPTLEPVGYDPEGAMALLAEAGASDITVPLTLYSQTTAIGDVQKFAEAIAGYWEAVGVTVELNAMDPAAYLDQVVKHQIKGAIILGMPGLLVSDPEKLTIFFASTGGYTTVKDAELDEMFAKVSSAMTVEEKEAAATDVSRYLYEKWYGLPIIGQDAVYALGPTVASFEPMQGNPYAGPFWYLRAN